MPTSSLHILQVSEAESQRITSYARLSASTPDQHSRTREWIDVATCAGCSHSEIQLFCGSHFMHLCVVAQVHSVDMNDFTPSLTPYHAFTPNNRFNTVPTVYQQCINTCFPVSTLGVSTPVFVSQHLLLKAHSCFNVKTYTL